MPVTPTIDYTNKDFASLRAAMLALARYRLPEWTDQSPADLGVLLVDLFAYMGDVILYYQDRIANEGFLDTAVERRSVLQLLRLIGYELSTPVPASTELTLTFKPPPQGGSPIVTVPTGAQFSSKAAGGATAQTFEYTGADLTIDLSSNQVAPRPDGKLVYTGLPVRQSRAVPTEIIGSSTGEPNMSFALSTSPVIPSSLVVEVDEGAGWVAWDRRASLLYDMRPDGQVALSGPEARDYTLQFDENDGCRVFFGDGTYGRRPPVGRNNIRATYSVGGGAAGNVPAGAVSEAKTPMSLLDSVTNPLAAAGGADHESIDRAVRFGPLAYRSGQRAVTLADYVALAYQAGGVAKVRAGSPSWNLIELYVAPEGDSCRPVPESMRRRLLAFFEDKRMAGTAVEILSATCVLIDVSLDIVPDKRFRQDAVRQNVEAAMRELLAFRNVDFAQTLYLSDVYKAVEAAPGVAAMLITRLRRRETATGITSSEATASFVQAGTLFKKVSRLQGGGADVEIDIDADGRVAIADYEIPALGALSITIREAPR
ncbi:baseplate J/gp47 family protein [Sorangium sp. So ce1000]|uniref:baseplate J/gp47 family protein n=1 Tax=Sorangium sp. So ce1000 TaxID=3133325 RepID=UPI003F618C36